MGAPTLMGGGTFVVEEDSINFEHAPSWRPRPDPMSFAILSAVVDELKDAGYQPTKPRKGKPEMSAFDAFCLAAATFK